MLGRKSPQKADVATEIRGFDAYDLRLGDSMRGERATMGKSLLDVQRELKIKANYIAAIENSDPSVFETPGFIAGYVRSYARFLGMDPDVAFQRFCDESGFAGVEGLSASSASVGGAARGKQAVATRVSGEDAIIKPMAPFVPEQESFFSRIEPAAIGSLSVMVGLIGLLGYGGWTVLQEIQRVEFAPVEQTPGIVAELDGFETDLFSAGQQDITAGLTAPSTDALDRLYRPQALEAPVLTARDGPIASLDPRSNGALAQATDSWRLAEAPILTDVEAPAPPPNTPVIVAEAEPDVVLFAVRPAWVRVASADGTILFEKTLDAGESYVMPVTDEQQLLRAGNSGSLFFNVQGKTYGPAGTGTSVAKNVPLGVEAITETYAEADPDAEPLLAETLTAMAQTPVDTSLQDEVVSE